MPTIVVRNLDHETKARLQSRAARNHHSMEAEARQILSAAVAEPEPSSFVGAIRALGERFGGVDLELARRDRYQRAVDLS